VDIQVRMDRIARCTVQDEEVDVQMKEKWWTTQPLAELEPVSHAVVDARSASREMAAVHSLGTPCCRSGLVLSGARVGGEVKMGGSCKRVRGFITPSKDARDAGLTYNSNNNLTLTYNNGPNKLRVRSA
jgi:hypothetical protein